LGIAGWVDLGLEPAVFGLTRDLLFRSDLAWHTPPGPTCADRLRKTAEARSSDEKAVALTQPEPERRFLENRLKELKK
jgi:hypothetical protein